MLDNIKKRRALVVDDHETNRLILRILLEEEGYAVIEAADGLEAVDTFGSSDFSVVLMDLQMPHLDGHGAIRAIRRIEAERGQPRTPVWVVSAFCGPADVKASTTAGADLHMAKPLEIERIMAASRQLKNGPASTQHDRHGPRQYGRARG